MSVLFSRGGKIRGRKISRNSIRSGYYFRGRKISRKIKIREYSEHFLHAKNWCYTVVQRAECHIMVFFTGRLSSAECIKLSLRLLCMAFTYCDCE